ncbi:hypothetical protein GW17_00009412 [Ensete ventricosum]|nr:hypothetical protein GW17_00009412 [Ensete ventricosum]
MYWCFIEEEKEKGEVDEEKEERRRGEEVGAYMGRRNSSRGNGGIDGGRGNGGIDGGRVIHEKRARVHGRRHALVVKIVGCIFFFGCRLIAICENIYTARAEGELEVEEVLYWTLVKIYRSPHMLLEYTKSD